MWSIYILDFILRTICTNVSSNIFQQPQFESNWPVRSSYRDTNTSMLHIISSYIYSVCYVFRPQKRRDYSLPVKDLRKNQIVSLKWLFRWTNARSRGDFVRLLRFLVRFSRFYQVRTWVNLTMVDLTDQLSYVQVDSPIYHNWCINSPHSACVSSWFSNNLLFFSVPAELTSSMSLPVFPDHFWLLFTMSQSQISQFSDNYPCHGLG